MKPNISFEYRITFIYIFIGVLWILFSDQLVLSITNDPNRFQLISIYKGWFFVIVTGLLLFFRIKKEIKHRNILYNQLIESKKKAEESDRLKTAFLQNVSHEIRTPMNAIMGFSHLLANNFDNKPKLEQFTGIINQRCNDLLVIIDDILDIAKIESGQLPVNNEECNLTELFSELSLFFAEYKSRIGKQHITVSLTVSLDLTETVVIIDRVKLKQILINLISNALKFTESGSIQGGCRLDENRNLLFSISDTGIGIPKDKYDEIFERFVQLDSTAHRALGGNGLGLSIVKGLVEVLEGKIWIESEPDKGSTFTFFIPYRPLSPLIIETRKPEKSPQYLFPGKTILVVEDDSNNYEYIKEILSSTGLNIIHAENGKKALQQTGLQSLSLVLMDIRLPDMDGYEVTRRLKTQFPQLKIIAQTAYASIDDKNLALAAGCVDYISKPTKQADLLSMVEKHIMNRK